MSHLNNEIRNAIDSFETDTARQLLRDALKQPDAETYYLASLVAVDDDQKLSFLNKAVTEDPFHEKAQKTLKQLTGKVNSIATPPPAQVITPPQQPINNSDIILPTATIAPTSTGVVYVIPHSRGTHRTNLSVGATVQTIGRDPKNNWVNITFITSIGQRAFGWIPSTDLVNFNFMGNPAAPFDLPISEFSFNTKNEMQEFISKIAQQASLLGGGISFAFIGGFFAFMGTSKYLEAFFFVGIGTLVMGLLLITWAFRRNSKVLKHGFTSVQLQNALKAKKSSTELMMEHQSQMMLMNIAGNMATRMVPNKQDVTVRYR